MTFPDFWRAVTRSIVQDEPMGVIEYLGGPRDGEQEWVGSETVSLPITTVRPVVVSPWGQEDAEPLCRVVRVGTYTRYGNLFIWGRE